MLGPVSFGSPQDIETALKLVKLVADPDAAATRLEELRVAERQANASIRAANEQQLDVEKRERDAVALLESTAQIEKEAKQKIAAERSRLEQEKQALERTRSAHTSAVVKFEEVAQVRLDGIVRRERELDAQETGAERARVASADAIAQAGAEAEERLRAATKAEADAKKALDEAEALRVKYDEKLAALRSIAQS